MDGLGGRGQQYVSETEKDLLHPLAGLTRSRSSYDEWAAAFGWSATHSRIIRVLCTEKRGKCSGFRQWRQIGPVDLILHDIERVSFGDSQCALPRGQSPF
jgi:hypothetical protein